VRVRAIADIDGEKLAGTFDVLLLARTGPRPLVRLQLLPDLGGKALDLVASPDHLRGRFPHTGEEIDWSLPDDAKAHPLLFIAITLLERFAPVTEDRLQGAETVTGTAANAEAVHRAFELTPIVEGSHVWIAGPLWDVDQPYETRFRWGAGIWWQAKEHEVRAKGFHLKLRDVKVEALGALDESLLKLK
jgi:hypothetical protein